MSATSEPPAPARRAWSRRKRRPPDTPPAVPATRPTPAPGEDLDAREAALRRRGEDLARRLAAVTRNPSLEISLADAQHSRFMMAGASAPPETRIHFDPFHWEAP